MSGEGLMILGGQLADFPLVDVIQVIAVSEKTGVLMVTAPRGEGGVGFVRGRVASAFSWDSLPFDARAAALRPEQRAGVVRARILAALAQLLPLRDGSFEFRLSPTSPEALGARDVSIERLERGVDVDELLLALG
jgi:Domain of unknown function (DUF4388)